MSYYVFHVYGPASLNGQSVRVFARSRSEAEDRLRELRLNGETLATWHFDRVEA